MGGRLEAFERFESDFMLNGILITESERFTFNIAPLVKYRRRHIPRLRITK